MKISYKISPIVVALILSCTVVLTELSSIEQTFDQSFLVWAIYNPIEYNNYLDNNIGNHILISQDNKPKAAENICKLLQNCDPVDGSEMSTENNMDTKNSDSEDIINKYFEQNKSGSIIPPAIEENVNQSFLNIHENKSLFVLGQIDLKINNVTLEPFTVLPGIQERDFFTNRSYTINLELKNGSFLGRFPFEPKEISEGEDAIISEVIPFISNSEVITITFNDKKLATREISRSQPVVKILAPNGGEKFDNTDIINVKWQAHDPDGDNLTSSLMYSPNSGKSWIFIGTDNKNSGLNVTSQNLPGGDSALFRIITSDGVNTALDDSDGTFDVSFKTPSVHIISPINNSNYTAIDSIQLEGEIWGYINASLPEYEISHNDLKSFSGNSSSSIFEWTSEKLGVLGYGNSTVFTGLAPGNDTITLTVRKNELSGNASVLVNISPVAPFAKIRVENSNMGVNNTILLNGNSSLGSGQLKYNWNLTAKPDNSTARINKNNEPKVGFFLDKPGNYTIQLTVMDGSGGIGLDQLSFRAISENSSVNNIFNGTNSAFNITK
jgi:hypothetical protein